MTIDLTRPGSPRRAPGAGPWIAGVAGRARRVLPANRDMAASGGRGVGCGIIAPSDMTLDPRRQGGSRMEAGHSQGHPAVPPEVREGTQSASPTRPAGVAMIRSPRWLRSPHVINIEDLRKGVHAWKPDTAGPSRGPARGAR